MADSTSGNCESRRAVSGWFFANGFITASWVAHVPGRASALDASPGALGLALLCMALGSIAGMSLAPRAAGRFGAGRSAWVAGLCYAFLLVLPLTAGSVQALGLALLVFGIAHGLMDVAMNTAAASTELVSGQPMMASFHGWFSVGMVVGVLGGAGAIALGLLPFAHAALTLGLMSILLLAYRPHPRNSHEISSVQITSQTRVESRAYLLAGLAFVCLFLEGAMADWSGLLAVSFGAGAATAPLAYAAFTVTWAGGRFLGDRLTAVFGDAALARTGGLLAAAGMGVGVLSETPIGVAVGCGIVGLGLANTVPVLFRSAAATDPTARGTGLALVTGVGYFGFLVGPPLVGFLAEGFGLPRAMLLVVAGGLLLAAGSGVLRSTRSVPVTAELEGHVQPEKHDTVITSPIEAISQDNIRH